MFGSVARGRPPGTITSYRWDGVLLEPGLVQKHVEEAVTGVISLDGLLLVCGRFGALPEEVIVIEIEPADESWGPGSSEPVEAALNAFVATIRRAALGDEVGPRRPLGGGS